MNLVGLVMAGSLLSYTVPSFEVAVERDVVYKTAPGYWDSTPADREQSAGSLLLRQARKRPLDLKMDIYTPVEDAGEKRPLLLMLHGGSFFIGNKQEKGQAAWCEYFASLGYVAASVDYRMGFRPNRKGFAQAEECAFEDASDALDFLLGRDGLGIDPDRIFIAGTSAGAMLALRLAFRPDGPRIRAIANCWGAVHDLGILEQARTGILSFQSPSDPLMPYRRGYPFRTGGKRWPPTQWVCDELFGTAAIHERALELGLRAEHHAFPEARHRLHLDPDGDFTPRFFEIRDRMATFFSESMTDD